MTVGKGEGWGKEWQELEQRQRSEDLQKVGIQVGPCETYGFANWCLRKLASCPPEDAGRWDPIFRWRPE